MAEVLLRTAAGDTIALPAATVVALDSRLRGDVLRSTDAGYDEARRVWNGMVDRRPALIARCAAAGDVVEAVRFAREHGLIVSVRGGGHNIAGKGVVDDGLTIDLSGLRTVSIDAAERTARVGGGALLGDFDREAQRFGLATTAGVVSHTGVGGLTLGGGVGRLARKHGLACDNLLAAEVVTADGALRRASPTENADLFWALRGGGGNFGVVTGFEFRLHPVGPEVLGGLILHPVEAARAGLSFYDEFTRAASDELSTDAGLLTSPDGAPVFAFSVCHVGAMADAERELEPLRRFGRPLLDDVRPRPYTEVQSAVDDVFAIGLRTYWKSHFLAGIEGDAIEIIVETFARVRSPRSVLLFQQYGGAVSRVDASATAFFHRDARFDVFPASIWTDPRDDEAQKAWVREWWDAMRPFSKGGEYVNNLGEEGEDRVRAAYGSNHDRLVALKTAWDPTNLFRLNANIPPAA